jgi:hypothetical protein
MADIPPKLVELFSLSHLASALCVGVDIVDPNEMRAEIGFGTGCGDLGAMFTLNWSREESSKWTLRITAIMDDLDVGLCLFLGIVGLEQR